MTDEQPKLPSILTQGKNAALAYAKWVLSGKPPRTPDQIEALFDFCAQCPVKQFIKISETKGRCARCGCWLLREGNGPNKLRVPTESCPEGLWDAQVSPEE